MSGTARIGLVGAGWRSDYLHRIAAAAPDRFSIGGVLVSRASSAATVTERWGVPATTDRTAFLRERFDFVVVSVPRAVAPELTLAAVQADLPVLLETPPAGTAAELQQVYRSLGGTAPVQVAEQYHLQPAIAARLEVARAGLLGRIHHVAASFAHDYHGLNVVRRALGVGFAAVRVSGTSLPDPVRAVRGRDGWLDAPRAVTGERSHAVLSWDDDRSAIYDFGGEQYVSPIRRRSLTITGDRGELHTDGVAYLDADDRPVTETIRRQATGIDGDLDAFELERLTLGARTLYTSPLPRTRLNDDELAVGTLLIKMAAYVAGGPAFSTLADGCHDHYLGLLVAAATGSGRSVASEPQPWDQD